MVESIKKISNPLTIIAIFAGLAEVSGTAVVPFLKDDSQILYVWFLMGFPTLLILLFFFTLNLNHKVLYAPSDFQNEDNFIRLFDKPTPQERLVKLSAEFELEETPQRSADATGAKTDLKYRDVVRRSVTSTHYLAEDLVITKLSQEFDEIDKEVMLRAKTSQFLFDAIAKKGGKVFAVEVKYLKDARTLKNVRSSLVKIQRTLQELPIDVTEPMTVIIAIATDLAGEEMEKLDQEIRRIAAGVKFPCEVRVFSLPDLEAELLSE